MTNLYIGDKLITRTTIVTKEAEGSPSHQLTINDIPSNVTVLGKYSFSMNYATTDLVIPEGITDIEEGCFMISGPLASVTFPSTLRTLGVDCFKYCGALKTVRFEGNPPLEVTGAFPSSTGVTFYYKADNTNWTETVKNDFLEKCGATDSHFETY